MQEIAYEKNPKSYLQNTANIFKKNISELIPLLGLIGVLAIFAIATKGNSLSAFNIKILINQGVILAVIATGSTFIFTMGYFDISLGAATCMACVLGAIAVNATGSPVIMVIVCICSAVCISLMNGACIAFLKLPSFIVTLATMNIISAVVSLILGSSSMITVKINLAHLDTVFVKVAVLLLVLILSVIMFNFNKLGRGNKIIGGNPVVAVQSGISIIKNTILTFIISGIGIGLGSLNDRYS